MGTRHTDGLIRIACDGKRKGIISKPDAMRKKTVRCEDEISDSMPDNQIQSVGSRPHWPAPGHQIQNR